ncbi:hypothetical protein [Flavobacterium kingsejongi]|uniref:Glycerophosphoryl diester phosphodiesterase membrane domain-containing protein n=1 Tax=Flavobacterium kingsejongi TaxID=1678728 RepID=A0A2S1LJC5_9FLAO|nr:hypothetical protein [Flavobacterium kingsejongi]AWG23828.1 hypothetical protein FK004_00610 [Flavobacterium kingsejongi]
MNYNYITKKIQSNQDLDFGDILNKSFELFKKVWLQGFLMVLVNLLIIGALVGVLIIPMVVSGVYAGIYSPETFYGGASGLIFLGAFLLFFLLFGFIMMLNVSMQAGFLNTCRMADLGKDVGFEGYFKLISGAYFFKTLRLSAAFIGIFMLGYIVCFLPVFYLIVPLSYFVVIYAFNPEMSVSNIINTSFKIGNNKWLFTIGMAIVAGAISQVGVLLCGIGFLFTASFARIPMYFIYKQVIGFDEHDEIDTIGTTGDDDYVYLK